MPEKQVKILFDNHDYYNGEYKNSNIEGNGIMIYHDGVVYKG